MEIVGKIKKIMDVQVISDRFKKREFVLSTDLNTPYPQHIIFQTTQEKCAMLDNLKPNDEVKVFFNIRGREWINPQDNQVKYIVTLEAWRIDKFTPVGVAPTTNTSTSYSSTPSSTYTTPSVSNSAASSEPIEDIIQNAESDDLPF